MATIKEINGVPLTGISQISGVTVTGTGLKNVAGTILNFSAAATVAPFLITPPTLSLDYTCANPFNPPVTINNMAWGGTPSPTITYDWYKLDPFGGPDIELEQYTEELVLQYDMIDMYFYCLITATNSAGVSQKKTGTAYSADCG